MAMLMECSAHRTVRQIAEKVGLSKLVVQRLLWDELSMSRVSA